MKRLKLSVYDLDPEQHGEFDLVFNYGLLYHLRHPLLSLDRVRRVCRGALVLETHVVNTMSRLPITLFYCDTCTKWHDEGGPSGVIDADFENDEFPGFVVSSPIAPHTLPPLPIEVSVWIYGQMRLAYDPEEDGWSS